MECGGPMYCINANYVSGNDMEKSKEREGNESLGFESEAGAIMDQLGEGVGGADQNKLACK